MEKLRILISILVLMSIIIYALYLAAHVSFFNPARSTVLNSITPLPPEELI